MLDTLDTIIAFVVIMTAVSLMITLIVQMCSAFLSLRGKNLANALALTFQTINPKIAEQAHGLAEYILKDPILSDSLTTRKSRQVSTKPGKPQKQAWGMLNPWGAFQLSTAIRPSEVYRILHAISALSDAEATNHGIAGLQTEAADLLQALSTPDQPTGEAQSRLARLITLANDKTTEHQAQTIVASVSDLGATVETAAAQSYDRFQRWFGTAQDRAEQWFQMHTRILAIAASFVLAFGLELDALEIFHQLRSNPSLVQALVSSAPSVLSQGHTVSDPKAGDVLYHYAYLDWKKRHPLFALKEELPEADSGDKFLDKLRQRLKEPADASDLLAAFDSACKAQAPQATPPEPTATPDPAAASATAEPSRAEPTPARQQSVRTAYQVWLKEYPRYALARTPDWEKASLDSVRQSLRTHLKEAGEKEDQNTAAKAAWLDEFKVLARQQTVRLLANDLEQAGFELAPKVFMSRWQTGPQHHKWPESVRAWIWFTFSQVFSKHFFGMLVTAGLLTLGAPFWFNLLKNLMNLRPAVATLIERRPTSSPALPQAPDTPNPPTS